MIFWLLVLGLFIYFIVQRSVANITSTPVWILWLVMMTPAFIWSGWILIYGEDKPLPTALVVGPFLICPILYWWLIQLGRRQPNRPQPDATGTPAVGSDAKSATETPAVRPITQTEETQLRNCFPWSVYYVQNLEYRPQAVICRGHLRSEPDVAYRTIRENIERVFGDRFLVIFQENLNGDPFFALVPNPQARSSQKQGRLTRPLLALTLLVLTLFTTTLVGVTIAGVERQQLDANPSVLLQGLPYGLALMTILGIHEMGHYLTARLYKLRTTLPYFIPLPPPFFLGTFGAFIQMRSPIPNRKVLFDVGIAGPLAGFVATLPILIWGLAHSSTVPLSPQSGMLNLDSFNPRFSILLTLLSKLALGSALTATNAIDLHPVAVAGYLGAIVTALNLMPVGQLDGGHIVHAMFGQRSAMAISQISRLLLLALSLVQPGYLFWAIFLFLMPIYDEPALNDVSQLDNRRDFWGLLALGLLVIIILPAPRFVTGLLNL